MGLRLERVKTEMGLVVEAFEDWWEEMVVQNGPRYQIPSEWVHLFIDFLGATLQLVGRFFDRLHYTLAHVVGVGLPLWALYHAFTSLLDVLP